MFCVVFILFTLLLESREVNVSWLLRLVGHWQILFCSSNLKAVILNFSLHHRSRWRHFNSIPNLVRWTFQISTASISFYSIQKSPFGNCFYFFKVKKISPDEYTKSSSVLGNAKNPESDVSHQLPTNLTNGSPALEYWKLNSRPSSTGTWHLARVLAINSSFLTYTWHV